MKLFVLLVQALLLMACPAQAYTPSPPNRYVTVSSFTKVTCPKNPYVVVGFGQSLSASHLQGVTAQTPTVPAYMMYDGLCYVIRDPVLGATYNAADPAKRASVWPQFARQLAQRINKPVVIIAAGAGGFSVQDWAFNVHNQMTFLRNQIAKAKAAKVSIDAFYWGQGETDAMYGTAPTAAVYSYRLKAIFAALRTDTDYSSPKPVFFVNLESVCSAPPVQFVRDGQQAIIDEFADVFPGIDMDQINATGRYDGCHLNDIGRSTAVSRMIEAVAPMVASAN